MSDDEALPRQAVLIVNAASRRGGEAFVEACELLGAAGIELTAAHRVENPEEIDALVTGALADGAAMVIVGGGDGTISSAIDHFLGRSTIFALLPLGTANSFARTLGIPLDLGGAVAVISGGRPRRIDLGCIDGDYFANAAAMGLSSLIAQTVPGRLKRLLGRLGYLLWALRCALRFRAFRLTVTGDDGRRQAVWTTEVRIANGSHHGGVEMVESATLDNGEIVVQAVTGRSLLGLAWSWFAILFKLGGRAQTVTEFRGRQLRLEARPRQPISIDGDLAAWTPVTVGVARAAVRVAAPRD